MLAGRLLRKTAATTTTRTTTTTTTTVFSSSTAFTRPRMSSTAAAAAAAGAAGGAGQEKKVFFGPFEVTTQVFLQTRHSFALVNLKPLLPGHVLVCPARPHRRLTDLAAPELADLWLAVQRVQRMLARRYFPAPPAEAGAAAGAAAGLEAGGSFNIAVQDGPEAGQTVPHVHVHVIPRIRGATAKPADAVGDELYEQMAGERGNVGGALWDAAAPAAAAGGRPGARPRPGGGFPRIEDADRAARSAEEMAAEAAVFRRVLREMGGPEGR